MDQEISGSIENVESPTSVDPWAAAFAALEQKDQKDSSEAATGQDGSDATGTEEHSGEQLVPDSAITTDLGGSEGEPGEPSDVDRSLGSEGGSAFRSDLDLPEDQIKEYRTSVEESVKNQVLDDISKEFIKRGIRNRNGVLGASMEDDDICKRDEDGVPHFFNPETGREFTGDNPRRQAQEWIDDYNKELARVFNSACAEYEKKLMENHAPAIAAVEFAPTYNKLDPIRRGMLDNVLEDYEIKDQAGKTIGYSCDLNKALALVDRQIAMIQGYAKAQKPKEEPSAPAVDMKASGKGAEPNHQPKSLAEAMEMIQNKELENMKGRR